MTKLPIRIGVVGARRGKVFMDLSASLSGKIRLEAVCDLNPKLLSEWKDHGIRVFDNYEKLLEDPAIDAVCIATPILDHAWQSIAALKAGKHVLSEVGAAWTLEECFALVSAAQNSQGKYMMAENCCFMRHVMMVQNMVERGVFGDIIHAEGAYLHQIIDLLFAGDKLTWRGQLRRDFTGNLYPTHSLGPVSKWLGINQHNSYTTTASFQSPSKMMPLYMERMLPRSSELQGQFCKAPDSVTTLLRTQTEALVEIRVDWSSPRPSYINRYALQGTKASFTTNVSADLPPLVWIEGHSPAKPVTLEAESWESLWNYSDKYEHPWWQAEGATASQFGHGGSDYFVLREFADAIIEGRDPLVNVYDSATWSSLVPLSQMSIEQSNCPVEVPCFNGA